MKKIYCEKCKREVDGGYWAEMVERFQPTFCRGCFEELFEKQVREGIRLGTGGECFECQAPLAQIRAKFAGKDFCLPCFVMKMMGIRNTHLILPLK